MGLYRKKPVKVEPVEMEAFQMTKERRWDNSEWPEWLNRAWNNGPGEGGLWIDPDAEDAPGHLSAEELILGMGSGTVYKIAWGDWIIQGIRGELYPCRPSTFEAIYEAA